MEICEVGEANLAALQHRAPARGVFRRTAAKAAAQAEKQQRERAEKTARRLRLETYAADSRVAFVSLQEQNLGRAMELLRKHHPQSGEEDLRGFEWRYLWQQCTGDELATFNHEGLVNTAVFSGDA